MGECAVYLKHIEVAVQHRQKFRSLFKDAAEPHLLVALLAFGNLQLSHIPGSTDDFDHVAFSIPAVRGVEALDIHIVPVLVQNAIHQFLDVTFFCSAHAHVVVLHHVLVLRMNEVVNTSLHSREFFSRVTQQF